MEVNELKYLVFEKLLVPNREYEINYHNQKITLKAKNENTLYADGTLSNGWNVRYSLDDSLFSYSSEYGYIYHMYDPRNNIVCSFDFLNYGNMSDIRNVHYDTFDGIQYHLPQIKIVNSHNLIIGCGNVGSITDSSYITIGKNNTKITLSQCVGITIGDDNNNIQCSEVSDVVINDGNDNIIPKSYSVVGCNNRGIRFDGDSSTILNNCVDVQIGGLNEVDNSRYVRISGDSRFNKISNSNCITIVDGYTNELNSSKIINIDKTNNNKIFTTNLELKEKNPFQKFYSVESTRLVEDINEHLFKRSDSQATTLNTKKNNIPSVEISKQEYYITNKIWETAETANFEKLNVNVFPNPKSDYTIVVGGGEYTYGDRVRLYANVYNTDKEFSYWEFYDENEKPINTITDNPYIFTITDNINVYAQIKEKEK